MVYGKNGTGKSTISEALSLLSEGEKVSSQSLEAGSSDPVDLVATPCFDVPLEQASTDRVESLVFNEDFIERHIRLKREGLETVVLFGEQVQVQEALEHAQSEHRKYTACAQEAQGKYEEAIKLEQESFSSLQESLKAGWAQRQKRIRGNSTASPVGNEFVLRVTEMDFPSNLPAVAPTELSEQIDEYLSVTDPMLPARPWKTLLNQNLGHRIDTQALESKLEYPTGIGIAAKVGESLQKFAPFVHQARELFVDKSVKSCPLCQQEVSEQYKQQLIDAIAEVIDDDAQAFSTKLDRAKLSLVELASSGFDPRLGQVSETFEAARIEFNRHADKWNQACERKKLNMYSSLDWDDSQLILAGKTLASCITLLENRADEIDEAIQERLKRKQALEVENLTVARFECNSEVHTFLEAKNKKTQALTGLNAEVSKRDDASELVANLSAQLMNAQVAVDEINSALRAIFAEETRLALSLKVSPETEAHYVLRSRGRAVRPDRLSVGERNIVALAYFFVSVRKRLDELRRQRLTRKWLVIGVDDPVSSLDMDNRLGIHGFLGTQIQRIFAHYHHNVKMVLLTHDLSVARELEKASTSALFAAVRDRKGPKEIGFNQVRDQLISKFDLDLSHRLVRIDGLFSKQNDYGKLINLMWKATTIDLKSDDTLTITIGNITRRVLEAFSTFIYNESSIPSQALVDEYARITSGGELAVDLGPGHRLFLHENSHTGDQLTAMSDFGGVVGIELEEQVRHVQKVLAFMFTLQPNHVTKFIKEKTEVSTPILERWCRELLGQNASGTQLSTSVID